MTFAHPDLWPLLLVAPAVGLLLALHERGRRRRTRAILGARWAALTPAATRGRRTLRHALGVSALLFVALAAMGPQLGPATTTRTWRGVDVVVALDVSRSMQAQDVPPDRLTRAKEEIRALAEHAAGDRLGLVLFAGEARRTVPLTKDAASFAALVTLADPTSIQRGGTNLAAAIDAGVATLEGGVEAGVPPRPGAVLLVTDGEDLEGRGRAAARRAARRGVVVHTVGLGTRRGGKIPTLDGTRAAFLRGPSGAEVVSTLDEASLERIAHETSGTYTNLGGEGASLVELYEDAVLPTAQSAPGIGDDGRRENRFQWPLLLAVLLAAAAFGLPLRRAAVASMLLLAACGGGADGAARDELARAVRALEAERYDEAAEAAASALKLRGETYEPYDAFVRGNVAFARSRAAAAEAEKRADDARRWMPALRLAEDALAAWQWAAASRPSWPEARRNVERALRWMDALREKSGTSSKPPPAPPPPPPPPPPPEPEDPKPDTLPKIVTRELPASRVLDLIEALQAKELEKRGVRRADREARRGGVERDW